MSISDLIKNKFVEEFTAISVGTLLTTLLLSFVLGLFVLVIYRVTFGGVSFSKSFALSLVMLSMVTSLAILTVRSNVVLSLGMVGALSIVRFRTAIKDPMDTVFMFWSIVIGIITGAGFSRRCCSARSSWRSICSPGSCTPTRILSLCAIRRRGRARCAPSSARSANISSRAAR